jgi:hypothetical protein
VTGIEEHDHAGDVARESGGERDGRRDGADGEDTDGR